MEKKWWLIILLIVLAIVGYVWLFVGDEPLLHPPDDFSRQPCAQKYPYPDPYSGRGGCSSGTCNYGSYCATETFYGPGQDGSVQEWEACTCVPRPSSQ